MKLESLNNEKEKAKAKSPPVVPEDNFVPFNEGDTVILKSDAARHSNDLKRIAGLELKVKSCTNKDLGEGVRADVLYLETSHSLVKNPYLAENFKRIL